MTTFILELLNTPVGQIMAGGIVVIGILQMIRLVVPTLRGSKRSDEPPTLTLLAQIAKNTAQPFNGETSNIKNLLTEIAENTKSMPMLVRTIDEVRASQQKGHSMTQEILSEVRTDIKVVKDRTVRE